MFPRHQQNGKGMDMDFFYGNNPINGTFTSLPDTKTPEERLKSAERKSNIALAFGIMSILIIGIIFFLHFIARRHIEKHLRNMSLNNGENEKRISMLQKEPSLPQPIQTPQSTHSPYTNNNVDNYLMNTPPSHPYYPAANNIQSSNPIPHQYRGENGYTVPPVQSHQYRMYNNQQQEYMPQTQYRGRGMVYRNDENNTPNMPSPKQRKMKKQTFNVDDHCYDPSKNVWNSASDIDYDVDTVI